MFQNISSNHIVRSHASEYHLMVVLLHGSLQYHGFGGAQNQATVLFVFLQNITGGFVYLFHRTCYQKTGIYISVQTDPLPHLRFTFLMSIPATGAIA